MDKDIDDLRDQWRHHRSAQRYVRLFVMAVGLVLVYLFIHYFFLNAS